jgi:hypothetical protein
MRTVDRSFKLAFLLVAVLGTGVSAQSVSDIVEQMYDAYEAQASGIDNYTLVQSAMGFETTTYFEKEMIDGRPVFVMRSGSAQGANLNFGLGSDDGAMGNMYEIGPELVEHGRYMGRESIGGSDVHVLQIDDLSQISIAQQSAPGEMDFQARSGTVYVDTELMIPRRLQFVGDATTSNGVHEVTFQIESGDVRNIDGLLVPFHSTMQISGLQAMMDPETQAQLQQMEEQLAQLPPEQREMMERMMGDQLEQLRQMAAGGGDTMSIEVVNSGPPSE